MIFRGVFLIFVLIFSFSYVSSLGISPAIKNLNFDPGKQVNITFNVLDAVDGSIYDVYLRGGDLLNYSSISSNSVNGYGSFILTINFPDKMEVPGEHILSVSVKERPSESSFISTVVEVGSIIKTFVPYPGYYGDITLNIPDVNTKDQIPVELYVINKGDNPLDIKSVYVDFVSSTGNSVKNINFTPVVISVAGERYFRKYADSLDLEPGNYIGRARVSYQDIVREVNRSFRVGSLFVNITNYTDFVFKKGIQKFYVTLESKWNSPVYGAYVDVNLTNGVKSVLFRTPSTDIDPWQQKTIESYIDTENLEGYYDLYLNASYHGKSTAVNGEIFIGNNYRVTIYIVSAVLALLFFIVVYFILKKIFFKRKKK